MEVVAADRLAVAEQRSLPRVQINLPYSADEKFHGQILNITEEGILFSVSKAITIRPDSEIKLQVRFPLKSITLAAKVKWCRAAEYNGHLVCGAEIMGLSDKLIKDIRRYVISSCFRSVIKKIKNKQARRYVLGFAKDFREYIFSLVDMDRTINSGIIDKAMLESKLAELNNGIVMKGYALKKKIDNKLIIKHVKEEFRGLVGCWAFRSQIMKRGFEKPKGYPGDYQTLETIYDWKTYSSDHELGYYFDRYFLNNPYADAVRNRKNILRDMLVKYIRNSNKPLKILNLASGSCREIRELYQTSESNFLNKKVSYSFLDWDDDALEFSRSQLKNICSSAKFNFIKEDIVEFTRTGSFFEKNGPHNFVYSIGLADYLPDRVLKRIIKTSYDGLTDDGVFVLAHKDKEVEFSHIPPEWFCDWEFIQRSEADLLKLVDEAGLGKYHCKLTRDATSQIFFVCLGRKNDSII